MLRHLSPHLLITVNKSSGSFLIEKSAGEVCTLRHPQHHSAWKWGEKGRRFSKLISEQLCGVWIKSSFTFSVHKFAGSAALLLTAVWRAQQSPQRLWFTLFTNSALDPETSYTECCAGLLIQNFKIKLQTCYNMFHPSWPVSYYAEGASAHQNNKHDDAAVILMSSELALIGPVLQYWILK